MPTYRKLHTKIIDSYDFAEMPDDFTRVFWMLLVVFVDSEGRALDNTAWLRSKMFPLRDDVQVSCIEKSLSWLEIREMIIRYQVNGRSYFYIPKFKTYQSGTEREAKSVLPAPPTEVMSGSGEGQEPVVSSAMPSATATATESVSVKERPNIFQVYESEIGTLTGGISNELLLAEKEYPAGWPEDAMREAARMNKRNWKYALAILKRWGIEGRGENEHVKDKPHISEKVMIDVPGVGKVEAKS